jgi:hypothetical protein
MLSELILALATLDAPPPSFAAIDPRAARVGEYSGLPVEPMRLPQPRPTPTTWQRTDSRGWTWTHPDRAALDRHVDAVERGYAAPVAPPISLHYAWPSCSSGTCRR